MPSRLHELAAAHGIECDYLDIEDRQVRVEDRTLEALLAALGVDPSAPPPTPAEAGPVETDATCHIPGFLEAGRAWGVACQIYGLRSARNFGIGDFEDLARLGEWAATAGADFLGVNPLHALFTAAPERCSPFSPSNRLLLNPLLIAIDRVDGFERSDIDAAAFAGLRASPLVDYPRVAAVKLAALRRIFERLETGIEHDLDTLRERHGRPFVDHAVFETVSAEMARRGHGAGWLGWPEAWKSPDGPDVIAFARSRSAEVAFHLWLQQVAERQLAEAADRLKRAGMRIGLYLDLAVGVAADGSATWSDPELTVAGARIGAPPDMFNAAGQDWGLAPLAPRALLERGMQPFRDLCDTTLRHAGALRIDHVMSLERLYWIPEAAPATAGAYVRYPMRHLLAELTAASRRHRAIVVGEDLGVVPTGFREIMQAHRIQSYRVLMFERDGDGFRAPADWPVDALACVATHDTATFAGWRSGADIELRRGLGLYDLSEAEAAQRQRAREREQLLTLLGRQGAMPTHSGCSTGLAADVQRLAASAPSRLFAVQLEDILGLAEQPNLPGTVDEHPNWRRRIPVGVEDLPSRPDANAILAAISETRPRP